MITKSLDIMKQKPGIYVVMSPAGVMFIESDAKGYFHQLKPDTFERDGVLSANGWNHRSHWNAIGPLQRVTS